MSLRGDLTYEQQDVLYAEVLDRGLLLFVVRGRLRMALAKKMFAMIEQQLEPGRMVRAFIDATETGGLDAEVRPYAEQWQKRNPAGLESVILFRSKLLDMAISLFRLAVRDVAMRSFSSEDAWEAAVAALVPGFVRKPGSAYFGPK